MIIDESRLTFLASQFAVDPADLADDIAVSHLSAELQNLGEKLRTLGFPYSRIQEVLSDITGMSDDEVDKVFKGKCREPIIGRICQWIQEDIPEYIILSRIHDAYLPHNIMVGPTCDLQLSLANELRLAARMIAQGKEHTEKARQLLKEAFSGKVRQIEIFIPSGMLREAILRELREALEILTNPDLADLREDALRDPSDLPEHFALRIWNSLR